MLTEPINNTPVSSIKKDVPENIITLPRSESVGDRISEFGFRMHGPSDEGEEFEEEEEEEADVEQYEIDIEGGLIFPNLPSEKTSSSSSRPHIQQSSSVDVSTPMVGQRQFPGHVKSDQKMKPRRQASESPFISKSSNETQPVSETTNQSQPRNEFFPEKTGAELADMLRQLKFAQKFAWLVGEQSIPTGLSTFNATSVPSLRISDESNMQPINTPGSFIAPSPLISCTSLVNSPSHQKIDTSSNGTPVTTAVPLVPRPKISAPLLSIHSLSIYQPSDNTQSAGNLNTRNYTSPLHSPNQTRSSSSSNGETPNPVTSFNSWSLLETTNNNENDETSTNQEETTQSMFQLNSIDPLEHSCSVENREPIPYDVSVSKESTSSSSGLEETASTNLLNLPPVKVSQAISLIHPVPAHHALTSPCLPIKSKPPAQTSRSLDTSLRYHRLSAGHNNVPNPTVISPTLKRIVEEHLNSQLPSGAAPLAGLDDEEETNVNEDASKVSLEDCPPLPLNEEPQERRMETPKDVGLRRVYSLPELLLIATRPHLCRSCLNLSFIKVVSPTVSSPDEPEQSLENNQEEEASNSATSTNAVTERAETPIGKSIETESYSPEELNPSTSTDDQIPVTETCTLRAVHTDPMGLQQHHHETENREAQPKNRGFLSPQSSAILRRMRDRKMVGKSSRPVSAVVQFYPSNSPARTDSTSHNILTRQPTTGLPPTPQVHMGACFTQVFEGCPLTINSTASWINPATNGQLLLFGSTDGIYFLSLKDLADSSLELLSPRCCHWLAVMRDTMMSLSGDPPQLYTHNLVTLMKMKASGHSMNARLGRISKLFPKRFSPSNKVAKTKGCLRANLVRHPFSGARYLCAAFPHEILVMEWFNPLATFIEIKRVPVLDMPTSLVNFDLLVKRDDPLPLVCLGVYRHFSRRGKAGERYRLHLIDLNAPSHSFLTVDDQSLQASSTQLTQPPASPAPPSWKSASRPESGFFPVSEQQRPLSPHIGVEMKRSAIIAKERNSVFLEQDRLKVVRVIQLWHNTVLVCFQDCAKLLGLNGRIKKNLYQPNTISFDGLQIQSVVGLRDSLLVFHPHGFLGKSLTGELTQEINDEKHVYRVLGHDRNIVVESRVFGGLSNNSNIYLLAGHMDSLS